MHHMYPVHSLTLPPSWHPSNNNLNMFKKAIRDLSLGAKTNGSKNQANPQIGYSLGATKYIYI